MNIARVQSIFEGHDLYDEALEKAYILGFYGGRAEAMAGRMCDRLHDPRCLPVVIITDPFLAQVRAPRRKPIRRGINRRKGH